PVRTLGRHDTVVAAVAYSADGRRLISASKDMSAKVWDVATGDELLTLRGHAGEVWAVALSPDGRRAVTASTDCTTKVWDVAEHTFGARPVREYLARHQLPAPHHATGQDSLTFQGHLGQAVHVALSPDGRLLVSSCLGDLGTPQPLRLWEVDTGREVRGF